MTEKITAIIQARTGSTRYPAKVLRPLAGEPMIAHLIRRLKQVPCLERIVLAVPDSPSEDSLIALAREMDIESFKGPEEDVLQRFILAAEAFGAKQILRVCGDNPLIDYHLAETLAQQHLKHKADHTIISDPIPLGTSVEAASMEALKIISAATQKTKYREHVTTYFYDHPDQFNILHIPAPDYLRGKTFRLTVDTDKDFQLMEKIYDRFYKPFKPIVELDAVIPFLETHPEIARHNSEVKQKNWRLEN
ncbi:MAG: cytidylyltransferase domain-containing protein [Nitrospinales bacterium]